MSHSRERLVSAVRTLCDEPPDAPLPDGLPSSLIFETLTTIEDEMLRDLDLSQHSRRVSSEDISLTQDTSTFDINVFDFHAPSYVYLQTSQSLNEWFPVEIVNHPTLLNAAANGAMAVAFYGNPLAGEVNWIPESGQRLRLWYERGANDEPTLADTTELGALYDSHLKLQTAAQCRELMKLDVGPVLRARLTRSESQWKQFTQRSNQRGTGAKSPVSPWRQRQFSLGRRGRGGFLLP